MISLQNKIGGPKSEFRRKNKRTKKASLSQEQLAERLNVSRQAITKWETDKGIPDVANPIAISDTFGLKENGALLHR